MLKITDVNGNTKFILEDEDTIPRPVEGNEVSITDEESEKEEEENTDGAK